MLKQNDDGKKSVYGRRRRLKLRKTSTCISDGSGNNAKHSLEKPVNFVFEIEWECCLWSRFWWCVAVYDLWVFDIQSCFSIFCKFTITQNSKTTY